MPSDIPGIGRDTIRSAQPYTTSRVETSQVKSQASARELPASAHLDDLSPSDDHQRSQVEGAQAPRLEDPASTGAQKGLFESKKAALSSKSVEYLSDVALYNDLTIEQEEVIARRKAAIALLYERYIHERYVKNFLTGEAFRALQNIHTLLKKSELVVEQKIFIFLGSLVVQRKVRSLKEEQKDATINRLKEILTNNKSETNLRLAAIEVLKDRSVKGWFTSRKERDKALKVLADFCSNRESIIMQREEEVWESAVTALAQRTADSRIAVAHFYNVYQAINKQSNLESRSRSAAKHYFRDRLLLASDKRNKIKGIERDDSTHWNIEDFETNDPGRKSLLKL